MFFASIAEDAGDNRPTIPRIQDPPLVRTYKQRVKFKGPRSCLPSFSILQRAKEDVLLVSAPKQWLPKGSRLLSIEHVPSPSTGGEDSERTAIEEVAAVSSNAACLEFSSNVNASGCCKPLHVLRNADVYNAIDDNAVGDIERDQQFAGDFLQTLNLSGTKVSGTDEVQVQIWGTPWSPDKFVGMAVKAGHPAMLQSFLPTQLSACTEKGMRMSCHERMAHRANMSKFWLRRSLQPKAEETALAAKLEPGVAEVLKGKRILLWKEMLQSINYVDMGVVNEFCEGSRLTGQTERIGLWPSKVTPATVTEQELHVQAKMQWAALTYGQVVFFDDEIAGAVWEQTLAEVAKGELDGPLELSQVPDHYPLSRRFGVKQNDKIRCVDDFSWSGINSAAQPLESPKPHTLDVIGGMMLAVMNQSPPGLQWLARSFDLKSAYRQCAVHPDARRFSYIVVGDPATSTLKAFRLRALPFGSVKSVHSFLRIAHSLWSILTSIFLIVTTNYFDDFVSLAAEPEIDSVDYTVKALFKILGWKFAEDGPKAPPFSKILTALVMDVRNLHNGVVVIDNTESRRIELARSIEEILQSKQLRRLDALRLRGRMQFAAGQLFGRVARRCLSVVTQHAYGMDNASVSESALSALQRFRDMLLAGSPRTLSSHRSSVWFIFTDASHEPNSESPFTGIGAVLVDELGNKRKFFSERMDDEMLDRINVSKRKTIIFECDFFALLCALVTWKDLLFRCSLVLHTDNDAVRDCFISCHTTSANSIPILDA